MSQLVGPTRLYRSEGGRKNARQGVASRFDVDPNVYLVRRTATRAGTARQVASPLVPRDRDADELLN